jgi:SAM-dependent methyltransferase
VTDSPTFTDRLRDRIYGDDPHPYDILEREVRRRVAPHHTLFEIGCGRTAPLLRHFEGDVARLCGVDLVDFRADDLPESIELHQADAASTGLEDASVDLAYSRAVMEHIEDADAVFEEMRRILRPGGSYVFLTPSLWDYASLVSMAVPNRFHPYIVRLTEGRAEEDVFPAHYQCNTRSAVHRLCRDHELEPESVRFLGQYPCYFQFNPALFLAATAYEKLTSAFELFGPLRGWMLAVVTKA